jgi:hypothetical protein
VSQEDISERGGWGLLLNYFNGSPGAAIAATYPEHTWELWRFPQTPKGWWSELQSRSDASELIRPFAESIAMQLSIDGPDVRSYVMSCDFIFSHH